VGKTSGGWIACGAVMNIRRAIPGEDFLNCTAHYGMTKGVVISSWILNPSLCCFLCYPFRAQWSRRTEELLDPSR
jgi:hypothetical protein